MRKMSELTIIIAGVAMLTASFALTAIAQGNAPRLEEPERTVSPAARPVTVRAAFPSGTQIIIMTTQEIDTDRSNVGDVFEASLEEPLMIGNQVVAPKRSTVTGRIANAEKSGAIAGKSQLILELTGLTVDGVSYALDTSDYAEVGASRSKQTARRVGIATGIGVAIGALAGGGRGALIGAGAGAATGTTIQALTKGERLKIPAETLLEFKLQSPLVIGGNPEEAYEEIDEIIP